MDNKNMLSDEELEKVNGGMNEREKSDIIPRVISIISEQLDFDPNMIQLNSVLIGDLGADAYDIMDIKRALEDSFGVCFGNDSISAFSTVEDIVHLIEYA